MNAMISIVCCWTSNEVALERVEQQLAASCRGGSSNNAMALAVLEVAAWNPSRVCVYASPNSRNLATGIVSLTLLYSIHTCQHVHMASRSPSICSIMDEASHLDDDDDSIDDR